MSLGNSLFIGKGSIHSFTSSSSRKSKVMEQRQVRWNVEHLGKLLKKIVATRNDDVVGAKWEALVKQVQSLSHNRSNRAFGATVLDEMEEAIEFPFTQCGAIKYRRDPDTIVLPRAVQDQLTDYVSTIASWYQDNPFHSFSHATHVGQSVYKLINRIEATHEKLLSGTNKGMGDIPENGSVSESGGSNSDLMSASSSTSSNNNVDATFAIATDPVAQFACVLATLIHDVDHPGVSNATLVEEKTSFAIAYNNKSISEQHSLDLGWE